MARFLADENFPFPIVKALRGQGHEVEVLTRENRRANDLALLARALAAVQILLTQDKDFAELVLKGGHPCFGIVHLSVPNKGGWKGRAGGLAARLDQAADHLAGAFTVLTNTQCTHEIL